MYEKYSRQALPTRKYRELLGSALCVFNANNSFIIENILHIDKEKYNWYNLIDKTSGSLKNIVKNAIKKYDSDICLLFEDLIEKRNRIVHSFQITYHNEQILATKDKENKQYIISEEFLLSFIRDNEMLCDRLYKLKQKIEEGVSIG